MEKKDEVDKEAENKKVMKMDDGEGEKVLENEAIKDNPVIRQKVDREIEKI